MVVDEFFFGSYSFRPCALRILFLGVDDEAGDLTGLAMNAYWSQDEILRADFKEMATGISDVCIRIS